MFDDILVPTDGSDCAGVAVDYAEDLATHYGSTVHALSAVDPRTLDNAPHAERERAGHAEIAEHVHEDLATADVTAREAVVTDIPHRAILDYAAQQSIDLVVMGTHGRTGVERYLLGSVAEKVVRLSDVPVLTVRETEDGTISAPFEDILVPTDGSEGAAAAVGPAVDLARTYDARLHALSVVDTFALGMDVRSETVVDTLENAARDAVEAVTAQADAASVDAVETAVSYGHPYREIRSYVEDNEVDLVVMGTHGRSGIERYLLGSVAEKLVRTSPAPVMTVRAAASSTE